MDSPEKPANLRTFLFALDLAIISGSSRRIERICRHHRSSGDATRTGINLIHEMVFSRVYDVNWLCILSDSFLLSRVANFYWLEPVKTGKTVLPVYQ